LHKHFFDIELQYIFAAATKICKHFIEFKIKRTTLSSGSFCISIFLILSCNIFLQQQPKFAGTLLSLKLKEPLFRVALLHKHFFDIEFR